MTKTILAMGEALVEVMRSSIGEPLDRQGSFSGPFASGAPAIYAVAAARLGFPVRFISSVGQDAFGRLLRRRLQEEGVDVSGLQNAAEHATGVAFVAYDLNGSREFVFHLRFSAAGLMRPEQVNPALFANLGWLHLSGSTLALNESCRSACWRAVELAKSAGGQVSFDPNLRPELLPVDQAVPLFSRFMDAADLLLPTASEAHALAGVAEDDKAAQVLLRNPHQILVYKRGAAGCTVYAAGEKRDIPGFSVEEVDPTGAGDCFNAAFLVGLDKNWSIEQTGRFACAAGALAVTRLGPMEGAPTRTEIEAFLN